MRYDYTAVGANRRKVCGVISADDKGEAIERLLNNNLTVLELREHDSVEAPKSIWERDLGAKDIHKIKLSKKKLLVILNQMAIMMKAGVSLPMAMGVMIDSQKDKNVRKILQEMDRDLLSGTLISQSMAKFRAFPELVVSMVGSGEENGRLDLAFERCAAIVEKEIALTSKIREAMGYPCFLLCLTVGMIIVMNVLVLPNFEGVFKQFGAKLPLLTVAVMAVSNFLMNRWYYIVGAVLLLVLIYQTAMRKFPAAAFARDRLSLRLPVVGEVLRQSYISRFCRVMASLVEAGVDIVRSLEIARDIIENLFIKSQLEQIIADVKVGVAINTSMARFPTFDSLLVSMIRVGEESGMLSDSLEKMAALYEQQTDSSTKRLTAMLEPAMTILIAVIVGTVVISIVMPMFGMYSVISGG